MVYQLRHSLAMSISSPPPLTLLIDSCPPSQDTVSTRSTHAGCSRVIGCIGSPKCSTRARVKAVEFMFDRGILNPSPVSRSQTIEAAKQLVEVPKQFGSFYHLRPRPEAGIEHSPVQHELHSRGEALVSCSQGGFGEPLHPISLGKPGGC